MALEQFRKQMFTVESSFDHEEKDIVVVTEIHAGADDLTRLSNLLKQPQLKYLVMKNNSLAHNQITMLMEGLSCCHLRKLDLTNNHIGDRGITQVCEALAYKPELTELVLEQTKFGREGAQALADLVRKNKSLTALDVSQNAFSADSMKLLVKAILSNNSADESSKLMQLDISSCRVPGDAEAEQAWCHQVGKLIHKCGTLEEILLVKNEISANGVVEIANGLIKRETSNVSLRVLDLSDNPLGDSGIEVLAERLIANNTLINLRVADVDMHAQGLTKLCEMIRQSDTLERLAIGENPIESDKLIQPLVSMLHGNETSGGVKNLKCLDISGIVLEEADAIVLGGKLAERMECKLQELNMAKCGITDEGVKAIAKGVKFNLELRVLDLTGNDFGPVGAEALAATVKSLHSSKPFSELRVSGARIEAVGVNHLAQALRYNRNVTIKGSATELDFLRGFTHNKEAFVVDDEGELAEWSHAAWTVVKKGYGAIIGTVLYLLSGDELKQFKENVLNNRNKVNQTMFECLIRHGEAPVMDALTFFTSKCRIQLDDYAKSISANGFDHKASTYRVIAQEHAKDESVKIWAKAHNLKLGRYKKLYGGETHQNQAFDRYNATDLQHGSQNESVFVQVYHNPDDFQRELEAREHFMEMIEAGGPFALDDSILKLRESHEEFNVISYRSNISSLSAAMDSLGACAGYDMAATCALALNCAQALGLINSYGRVHGDFRPKNLMMVARARTGYRNGKEQYLPEKWVLFDFSKSVRHGEPVAVREDSAYLPPEVAKVVFNKKYWKKQLPKANEAMDVWAFGVVLYQLLTGVHLFHVDVPNDRLYRLDERAELMNWLCLDKDREELVLHRGNEGTFHDEASWKMLYKNAKDLVHWCLQEHPANRPTFNEILRHPFLKYKRNIAYNNVELLLNWYEVTGRKHELHDAMRDRSHAHVVNTSPRECFDAMKTLAGLFRKAGAKLTKDDMDSQLDVKKQREAVKKARCLIVLLTKDALLQRGVVQKLVWAMDSPETTRIIFLDMATAGTGAEKFQIEELREEYSSKQKGSPFDVLLDSLVPGSEKLKLENIKEKVQSKKELRKFLNGPVMAKIVDTYDQVMPFRTTTFLAEAMVKEIMIRCECVPKDLVRPFNGGKDTHRITSDEETAKVLILHNQDAIDKDSVVRSAKANPTMNLRKKMMGLNDEATEVIVYNNSFENKPTKEEIIDPHFSYDADRVLRANSPVVVLCLVTEGFLALFKDVIVPLSTARGPVVVKLLAYDGYVPSKDEIMNIGLEISSVGDIALGKTLHPLHKKNGDSKYEHEACLNYILERSQADLGRVVGSTDFDTYDAPTTIC